jgi:anti-sigma factor RsiW
MEHHKASATRASERYLLGEMSEPERFEFEEHYFDCAVCADDVRTGAALSRGIKAVCAEDAALGPQTAVIREVKREATGESGGWFRWLSFPVLAPSAVALLLGCVVAYQSLVMMPGMRWAESAQALAPVVLRAEARGEEQPIDVSSRQAVTMFSIDVNAAAPGAPLAYEVDGPGGGSRLTGTTQAPPLASPLVVMLPNSALREAGAWVLILRARDGAELARYPFSVRVN